MNLRQVLIACLALALSIITFPLINRTNHWLKWTLPMAELLVRNGVIYTSDESMPFADAMAVRGGRILAVGNYSSVKFLSGSGTKELDLGGKIVVPGFIDSHVHLIYGGLQMMRVDLHGVTHKEEFLRRVKAAAIDSKQGSWVLGGGWNNDMWGGEWPNASWIDDFTPNNPVWLIRMDGHMGLANSVALKLAGITNMSKDPEGGSISTVDGGNIGKEPTGLLVDSAMKLILPLIPEASVDERREALHRASNLALMRGVTTVVDFGRYIPGASPELVWEDFSDVYKWADTSGKMKMRVCLFFPLETWSRLFDLINRTGKALSQWIYLGGVKDFADGSLGSKSALFYEPYVGEPHNHGLQLIETESLFNLTLAADKFGLQIAIHAIGDRANDIILDMYQSVSSVNGMRDRRFRVEHAQHLAIGSVARFGLQNIFASVQPEHLHADAYILANKLGIDRAKKGSFLFRSILDSNGQLAFSSDWPVVDLNPIGAVETAMKRTPPGWKDAWVPSECLSLKDSLNAHTIVAACACFLDNDLGSLSPGKLADFVVLSTKSWHNFAAEGSGSVEATYVGGVQAYP